MILVTTGTNGAGFDRLLHAVDALETSEEIVVQHGPSAVRPRGARCLDFVTFDELEELMRSSRVVVTHGGVGSILLAVTAGKRPVVVPRLAAQGEAVDDHQLWLARRLAADGTVVVLEDERLLEAALDGSTAGATALPETSALSQELRGYVASVTGSTA